MRVEFIRIMNADPMLDVRESALLTVRKKYNQKALSPQDEYNFWNRTFDREESIAEIIMLKIRLSEMPKKVIGQIVRHTKFHPRYFVQTSRPDLTGQPRNPDELISMDIVCNPLALIYMARQRMCTRAEKQTQEAARLIRGYMRDSEDTLLMAIGDLMMPDCVYRGRCAYGKNCFNYV